MVFVAFLATSASAEILAFQAKWCHPCHQMEPTLRELEKQGYVVKRIDVDINPKLADKYAVKGLPTYVILKDGKEKGRVEGFIALKLFLKLLRAIYA